MEGPIYFRSDFPRNLRLKITTSQEETMNRRDMITVSAFGTLALVLLPTGAIGQQKSLKDQLAGTWTLVSSDTVAPNGTRTPTFGANPKGIAVFDPGGRYVFAFTSTSLPKFASNNRMSGTPEEHKAVIQGSLSHFGTYAVDEAAKSFTLHTDGSSFPNWIGTEQKRPFTISGDDLKWTTPVASGGGTAELVWKRAK
jgi:Lipocalin-like domain